MDEGLLGRTTNRAGEPVEEEQTEQPPRRDGATDGHEGDSDRRHHQEDLRDDLDLPVVITVREHLKSNRPRRYDAGARFDLERINFSLTHVRETTGHAGPCAPISRSDKG